MKFTEKLGPRLVAMQTASSFDQNNARIIASAMPQDNIARLLTEVEETVLARSLHFTSNTGAKLGMDVASRRVLRILDITDANGTPATDPIVGKTLSEDDAEGGVLQMIRNLAEGAEEITVTTAKLTKGGDGGGMGLPVAYIAKLMSGDPQESTANAPATGVAGQFLAQVNDVKAWFIAKGADAGAHFGDPDIVDVLHQFANNGIKNIESQLDQLGPETGGLICALIGGLAAEGTSIICLRTKDQLALAVIPADSLGSVLSAWKNI